MQRIMNIKLGSMLAVLLVVGGGTFGLGYKYHEWVSAKAVSGLDFRELNEIYGILQRKFDGPLDKEKLLDGAKAGMAAATGDLYTSYLDEDAYKQLNDDLAGTLSGIGAEVAVRNSKLIIVAPITDSPAAKAGLRPNDQVLKINDEDPSGLSLEEAVGKIRGEEGTTVKLLIARGSDVPFEVTITRAVITVESVKWSMKPNQIGYIQITRFGADTAAKLTQASRELKGQGARKIVLDMRNNPGGYLEAAVRVADEWLVGELVVEERKGERTIEKLSSSPGGELAGIPTMVLINGGSASASEIVAGALQDHNAARVVGEKSFGKGSVQEVQNLTRDTALKVTVAHWYTPQGKNITKDGIKPDVEVKREPADFEADRDPQLDRALELLK
jgi:carboxyl-terminal processing protease